MNKREYRFVPARELRVSKSDDGKRTLSGYAAVFNSLSEDLGGFREQIKPGAFTRCLRSNPDVSCLHEHDPRQGLLGRTKSGTLRLSEDNIGLRFECDLPNTTLANDVAESIDRGDLDGCSFGFIAQDDDWSRSDGMTLRTLNDADVFDVTVTSMPAYPATSVQVRSRLFPDGTVEVPELRTEANPTGECDQLLAAVLDRRSRQI